MKKCSFPTESAVLVNFAKPCTLLAHGREPAPRSERRTGYPNPDWTSASFLPHEFCRGVFQRPRRRPGMMDEHSERHGDG
jgi:hypothetical protein